MKRYPRGLVPRESVYRLYWYFAAERHRVFNARTASGIGPWTDDPILQIYKFCNVYRAADRVSQYMIRDVCYHDEICEPQDRLFQIVAFRMFSRTATWDGVREKLGRFPTLQDLADDRFARALDDVRQCNGGLYTGAFILCATDAYGRGLKHLNHVELLKHMFLLEHLGDELLLARSLGDVFRMLRRFPLVGDFMAYQTAIDLNYSSLINFSENDFTCAGPGALRGIKKMFVETGTLSPPDVIHWMVENQAAEFERFGLEFSGLFGRPLHAIDCQGLFCEVDKYCREAAPDLASARKRIKAKFKPGTMPIDLLFPPKWGLEERTRAIPAPPGELRLTLF